MERRLNMYEGDIDEVQMLSHLWQLSPHHQNKNKKLVRSCVQTESSLRMLIVQPENQSNIHKFSHHPKKRTRTRKTNMKSNTKDTLKRTTTRNTNLNFNTSEIQKIHYMTRTTNTNRNLNC